MTPIHHIRRMLPLFLEGLVIGTLFTCCIVIVLGLVRFWVLWL